MVVVVASIGSEGLFGTEALQSCLPHQLDLRTGQLWADGQSTLQLHQQQQAVRASLVMPPDRWLRPCRSIPRRDFHRCGVP